MDRDVIERKLEALRHCIARVRVKRPPTAESLAADADLQDVLVLNLSRAVQVCVDIGAHLLAPSGSAPPTTMGETFTRLGEVGLIDTEWRPDCAERSGFATSPFTTTKRSTGKSSGCSPVTRWATSRPSPGRRLAG